jgi:hypothetical protein
MDNNLKRPAKRPYLRYVHDNLSLIIMFINSFLTNKPVTTGPRGRHEIIEWLVIMTFF